MGYSTWKAKARFVCPDCRIKRMTFRKKTQDYRCWACKNSHQQPYQFLRPQDKINP